MTITDKRKGLLPMRGLTLKQIAEKYGVAPVTARQWQARGCFPHAKLEETVIGRVWIVPRSDLKAFTPPKMGRPKKEGTEAKRSATKAGKPGQPKKGAK